MENSTMAHSNTHPATRKRGGNPDVKAKPSHEKPSSETERKLEEGLEESMAGSDPVSITQPKPNRPEGGKGPDHRPDAGKAKEGSKQGSKHGAA